MNPNAASGIPAVSPSVYFTPFCIITSKPFIETAISGDSEQSSCTTGVMEAIG